MSKELRVVKRCKMWEGLLPKLTTGRIEQGCLTCLILSVLEGGILLKDLPLCHLNHLNHPKPEKAGSEAEVQPEVEIVVGNEQQPEPVIVEICRPLQPDQPTKPHGAEVDDPGHILPLQPEQPSTPQYNEVDDPVPINMEIMLETQEQCSLTLQLWLQSEARTSTAAQSP
ncbi:hypothetical protein PIB30_093679 [Stylosanthes scabra]|uniref:Uncharacterized protein n=1 Tax=Stylosanthes scabra TaxID=79078 RepID=A0ABU6RW21_9FABA|nr:hypothetical protein [Stylosanthes scabra]